jgi:hypothetical protein
MMKSSSKNLQLRKYLLIKLVFVSNMDNESTCIARGKVMNAIVSTNKNDMCLLCLWQLCSMTLVTGLLIILRSATKITHKAQAVTSLAAKWHICATLDTFDSTEGETPRHDSGQVFPVVGTDGESDGDDAGDEEDELDNSKLIPAYAYSTISFQKRQALGMYSTPCTKNLKLYWVLSNHVI